MPSPPVLSEPISSAADLPPLVAATRARLLAACRSGEIEALRAPIDSNEVRPLFERSAHRDPGADPIAALKRLSFDGAGRETLRLLRAVLTQACVRQTRGPTTLYIWPAFALRPPVELTADDRQTMLTCVRFADLSRFDWSVPGPLMRVGIGADGVWHYFWNEA